MNQREIVEFTVHPSSYPVTVGAGQRNVVVKCAHDTTIVSVSAVDWLYQLGQNLAKWASVLLQVGGLANPGCIRAESIS